MDQAIVEDLKQRLISLRREMNDIIDSSGDRFTPELRLRLQAVDAAFEQIYNDFGKAQRSLTNTLGIVTTKG